MFLKQKMPICQKDLLDLEWNYWSKSQKVQNSSGARELTWDEGDPGLSPYFEFDRLGT